MLLEHRIGEQFDAIVTGAAEKGTCTREYNLALGERRADAVRRSSCRQACGVRRSTWSAMAKNVRPIRVTTKPRGRRIAVRNSSTVIRWRGSSALRCCAVVARRCRAVRSSGRTGRRVAGQQSDFVDALASTSTAPSTSSSSSGVRAYGADQAQIVASEGRGRVRHPQQFGQRVGAGRRARVRCSSSSSSSRPTWRNCAASSRSRVTRSNSCRRNRKSSISISIAACRRCREAVAQRRPPSSSGGGPGTTPAAQRRRRPTTASGNAEQDAYTAAYNSAKANRFHRRDCRVQPVARDVSEGQVRRQLVLLARRVVSRAAGTGAREVAPVVRAGGQPVQRQRARQRSDVQARRRLSIASATKRKRWSI